MTVLNVSYFRQTQTVDCLASCIKMVADYHGKVIDYPALLEEFSFHDVGLYLPQVGSYFQKLGFKTEIVGLNPFLFNAVDIGKTPEEIKEKIISAELHPDMESTRDYFLNYLNSGGSIQPEVLTSQIIINEINNNNPVIVPICSRVMHGHKKGFNFHADVINGYNETQFHILDPAPSELSGGIHWVDQQLVMNAIHMTAYADPDNAFILKVAP